jgi:hypothetical protein
MDRKEYHWMVFCGKNCARDIFQAWPSEHILINIITQFDITAAPLTSAFELILINNVASVDLEFAHVAMYIEDYHHDNRKRHHLMQRSPSLKLMGITQVLCYSLQPRPIAQCASLLILHPLAKSRHTPSLNSVGTKRCY